MEDVVFRLMSPGSCATMGISSRFTARLAPVFVLSPPSILYQALESGMGTIFSIEDHINNIKISPFHNNLLADLRYRIQNLQAHALYCRMSLLNLKFRLISSWCQFFDRDSKEPRRTWLDFNRSLMIGVPCPSSGYTRSLSLCDNLWCALSRKIHTHNQGNEVLGQDCW